MLTVGGRQKLEIHMSDSRTDIRFCGAGPDMYVPTWRWLRTMQNPMLRPDYRWEAGVYRAFMADVGTLRPYSRGMVATYLGTDRAKYVCWHGAEQIMRTWNVEPAPRTLEAFGFRDLIDVPLTFTDVLAATWHILTHGALQDGDVRLLFVGSTPIPEPEIKRTPKRPLKLFS
jgi:hypothetical protein